MGNFLENVQTYKEYKRKWRENHSEQVKISKKVWNETHPSFVNWNGMMTRCYNPKHAYYKYYGGRGITVYNRWKKFPVYEKEFGYLKPGLGYTVDRFPNNDGNYEPGNVRWITHSENSKRKNKVNKSPCKSSFKIVKMILKKSTTRNSKLILIHSWASDLTFEQFKELLEGI
jgi:hypothetical protein